MAAKVYAVRSGTLPGLYDSWSECQAQVQGVSGAEYKSFKSRALAQTWLDDARDDASPEAAPRSPAPDTQDPAASAPAAPPVPQAAAPARDLPPWDLPDEAETQPETAAAQPLPQPTPEPREAPPPSDLRQQLEAKAAAFLSHLQEQGVPAYAAAGGSEYRERIGITGGGWVDLYHTRKKPFNPVPQRFTNPALRDRVMALWRAFHWAGQGSDQQAPRSAWDAVEHYHRLLSPYAALRFDFVALARALRNASPDAPDPEAVRYDFPQIQAAYRQLRPQTQ